MANISELLYERKQIVQQEDEATKGEIAGFLKEKCCLPFAMAISKEKIRSTLFQKRNAGKITERGSYGVRK